MKRTAIYYEFAQVKPVSELIVFDVIPTENGDRVIAGIDARLVDGVYVAELSLCTFTDLNSRERLQFDFDGGVAVIARFEEDIAARFSR